MLSVPTIDLRHRTASGQVLSSVWEIDRETGHIVAFVRMADGAPTVGVDLLVCSSRHPKVGGVSLSRVDETTWKLMPARYRHGGGVWSTLTSAYDADAVLPLWPIMLTHARAEDSEILEKL